jgi:type II secretory pathway predicted ATPase ExeA
MDDHSLVALVLVGQPDLHDRLRLHAYTAIRQRITVQCQLLPWERAEVEAYITQQLAAVGVDHALFTAPALDVLYQASGGVARLVNQMCTQSLWYGAQQGHHVLDDRMVSQVLQGEGW